MKILVIGLGSMGKRRARLVKKICPDAEIIGADFNEERCRLAEEELEIETVTDMSEVLNSGSAVDYAFISTSPLSHGKIINECLEAGANVFTEINLVKDMYDENLALAKEKKLTLYLSSTGLFRNEMVYMINRIKSEKKPLGYTYHVGQYLPDWHPWESYKDFFIGNKRTNGCREILGIELPWMVAAFGPIKDVQFVTARKTDLDIEFNDMYSVIITHENGNHGTFSVDVVCRKPVRDFKVFGEDIFITWKGSPESLLEYDLDTKEEKQIDLYASVNKAEHVEGYNPLIVENAYESEIIDFFAVCDGKKEAEHTFEKDKAILDWIDVIEGI